MLAVRTSDRCKIGLLCRAFSKRRTERSPSTTDRDRSKLKTERNASSPRSKRRPLPQHANYERWNFKTRKSKKSTRRSIQNLLYVSVRQLKKIRLILRDCSTDVLINFDQLTLQPRSFTHKNKLRENKCAAIFALHNSWNILRFENTSGGGKGRKRKVINLWKKNI